MTVFQLVFFGVWSLPKKAWRGEYGEERREYGEERRGENMRKYGENMERRFLPRKETETNTGCTMTSKTYTIIYSIR